MCPLGLRRKRRLKVILRRPKGIAGHAHILYVDHVRGRGKELFDWACAWDLEGIVAKRADSRYEFTGSNLNRSPWKKIKNSAYSQKDGRDELFEKRQTSSF